VTAPAARLLPVRTGTVLPSVFGSRPCIEGHALAGMIDPLFLDEIGWDAESSMLLPSAEHRLLGRRVCQAAGCETTTVGRARVCLTCRRRLQERGLGSDDVDQLSPLDAGLGQCCLVEGCARECGARKSLCPRHREQRAASGLSLTEFLAHPHTVGFAAGELCPVAACPRQRRGRGSVYCAVHQVRWRTAVRADPAIDENHWRAIEPAVGVGGQISLRGLPQMVVAEVLFGLQQRCRVDRVRTKEADLRAVCDDIRRTRVRTVADYRPPRRCNTQFAALANTIAVHAHRGTATPETEVLADEWDLGVFGHAGTVSFTAVTQEWLRAGAKRWAADDLPRRRIRTGRRTSSGLAVRHYVNSLARLSESLRVRPDKGDVPAALGRADIGGFLNRLGYLTSTGQLSADGRIRAVREVRHALSVIRGLGLTRPGAPAAGLSDDFVITADDVPAQPEPADSGRDLPPEVISQVCAHLGELTSVTMRTAVELAIDTGRRPEEVCDLAWDCLARDNDNLPVLVYDNHKANRMGRRLPIAAATAETIINQQRWVQDRYPHTAISDLKLLPTDRRNPLGTRAITAFSLSFHHRTWLNQIPVLHTADGVGFDKSRVVLYAYRHSYAQRHADAGVPIDVLRELMDHRQFNTTSGYYQVGYARRREAVDRVAAMQFDRHGKRIWRSAQTLLDSEQARRGVGEVAVPFGVCAEPSNVQAGGNACPYRFRCAGCDHFRTDISYLPDLRTHLDDLLRTRERLIATRDLDDWARAEAMPSEQEITRIRRLISKVEAGLDQLTEAQRAETDQAVALLRRHRTVTLGMPNVRQTLSDLRPERS
jgi:integrase